MNEVIKICKYHGELNFLQVIKRGEGRRCKICVEQSRKKHYSKVLTIDEIKEKLKNKKCSVHGRLLIENIHIEGATIRCRTCRLVSNKEQREKYKDKYKKKYIEERRENVNARLKEKRLSNLEEYRAYGRDKYQANRERYAMLAAARRRNISLSYYESLIESQNNLCAICGNEETRISSRSNEITRLCIDHDHASGKVRALLCANCNSGIGKFKDDIQILQSAIEYLKKHKDNPDGASSS